MPREVTLIGPRPPEGEKFCTMCALGFKTALMEQAEVTAAIEALATGDGPPTHYSLVEAAKRFKISFPDLAVTIGVSMQLNGVLVPVCWTHVQALHFTSIQQAPAGLAVPGRR